MKRPKKRQVERTNAVIYCRVSTEEQVQNLSLGTQEHRAIAHCAHHGWPVVRVFRDEGKSAKTTQREEFQKMLTFCADPINRIGFVVVHDLSRFSRNTNDLIATRAQLFEVGVLIRSVSESIDESSTGNFMTAIFGAVHQLDNERKSERTKSGMQAAAAMGRWPHKAPVGYVNVVPSGDGPNVVPDPLRSPLVRQSFEMAASGLHSKADILRTITKLGLLTVKGKPLSAQTFQMVLRNPFYAGWMVFSDTSMRFRGRYEPLVTQELFNQVQEVLDGRRPALTGYRRNRPEFPLKVFVKCAHCGAPLTGSASTNGKSAKRYPSYRCRENCKAVKAHPDNLHSKFLGWLQSMAPNSESMEAIKDAIRTAWKQRQGDAAQLRGVLKRKLTEVETRKVTLVNRWLDGHVDQKTFDETNKRLTEEIESVRVEIGETELEHLELDKVLDFADKIVQNPARLWVESSLEQRQRLQKTLFPNGISFDGKEFGTQSSPCFFSFLQEDSGDDYGLASPTGFEPVLSP